MIPLPFTSDEIIQFAISFIGDSQFQYNLQSALCPTTSTSASTSTTRRMKQRKLIRAAFSTIALCCVILFVLSTSTSSGTNSNFIRGHSTNIDSKSNSNTDRNSIRDTRTDNTYITRRLNSSSPEHKTYNNNNNSKATYSYSYGNHGETVIAIGVSNDINTYKQFVGSLRHSGFNGAIILGRPINEIQKNQNNGNDNDNDNDNDSTRIIQKYLHSYNVIIQEIEITKDCTNHLIQEQDEYRNVCIRPYTNVRLGWTGHLLARDWLKECNHGNNNNNRNGNGNMACNGPVLLSPLKNVVFQRNPFTNININKKNLAPFLYLHEDHPSKTINDNFALLQCKKFQWNVPHLNSIVFGDATSMSFYLENVIAEVYSWMSKSECYLSNTGVAIHNYLFYNGMIRPSKVYTHGNGLVNSVGGLAKEYKNHVLEKQKLEGGEGENNRGSEDWENVSKFLRNGKYINEDGDFLNMDGSGHHTSTTKSTILYQVGEFGNSFHEWLNKQPFMKEDGNDAEDDTKQIQVIDNPVDNSLFYLSLESASIHNDAEKVYLRTRKVMGKVVISQEEE